LTTIELIDRECENIKALLIAKNKAYGNSFAEPINIFCQLSAEDQINVRIDDKLNRIKKGQDKEAVPEDTELDLIGYLILKRVLRYKYE
jgi:4-diphosphocytidyl-2C-methyl-D-erythritol kinase